MTSPWSTTRVFVILLTSLAFISSSQAQTTYTWNGSSDNNWGTGTNWSPTLTAFATNDTALFDITSTANLSTTVGATAFNLGQIQITGGTDAVAIGGTGTLTLNGVGGVGIDMSAANRNLTVTTAIALGASQSWTVNDQTFTTGNLGLGTNTLAINGTGLTQLNGVISGTGSGSVLIKNGSGQLILRGTNTFTGQKLINAGIVTVTADGALGAGGVGNETIVTGGTLDVGGRNLSPQRVQVTGMGAGGVGAIANFGTAQINALQFVQLTGDATFNAGVRFDIRASAFTAGAQNLNLNGFTLTKIGTAQFSLVNLEVVGSGGIVVNQGTLSIEANTQFTAAPSLTVNPNGRLGFFSIAGTAVLPPTLTINGGAIGDTTGTSGAQTITSSVVFTGGSNPTFIADSAAGTNFSGVLSTSSFSGTEIGKRGAGLVILSNAGNTFDVPLRIYQGTLQANFATPIAGGVAPAAPVALAGTPLGTASTIILNGGTLNIRFDGANDATNQQANLGRNIVITQAPSGINLDRLSGSGGSNKLLIPGTVTFEASPISIGQNQLTMAQTNAFRLQLNNTVTLNNDTVFNVGDFIFNGPINAPGGHSFVKTGANSFGFIAAPGANSFGSLFLLSNSNLRVGSMFGTGVVSNTATAGTGPIYLAVNSSTTFRTPTNLATDQTVEVLGQTVTMPLVNFEQFTAVPTNLRALGTGVIGVSGATAFGNTDLGTIGDGTFRIGSGAAGLGNGTITGVLSNSVDGVVRLGASGTTILNGINRLTGTTRLDIGGELINGGFRTAGNVGAQNGIVNINDANNFSGGTVINRSSTLNVTAANALGTGTVDIFGTLNLQGANGSLNGTGGANTNPVVVYGGSSIILDSSGLAAAAPDVNRWGDSASLALVASNLTFNSKQAGVATTAETIGALSFAGGATFNLNRTGTTVAGQNLELTIDSLTRVGTGTLEIIRNGGTGAGFGNGHKVFVTTGAPTPVNGIVSPFFALNDVTQRTTFANYNPATGFVLPTFTNVVTTAAFPTGLNTGTETVYVDYASGVLTTTLGDNPIVYAMKVGAGAAGNTTNIANGAGNTITLRSGGLIVSGDNAAGRFSTGDANQTVNFANNFVANDGSANIEMFVNVRSNYTANLNGTVTANGLTKFGGGTLNFFANNGATLTGTVAINQGTVQAFGPTTAGTFSPLGSSMIALGGGQLNLRTSNTATGVAFTMQNGVTLQSGIPIATIDINRAGSDTTSTVSITMNPATSGPGLIFEGSPGVQGQTLTLSGTNHNLIFGDNAINSSTGNVTFNLTGGRQLQLNNSLNTTGTNPIITKSGDGILMLGVTAGGIAAPGTQFVVNAGTLDLRGATAQTTPIGTGTNSSIVLNAGTLNLRSNNAITFGGATPNPVTANGNSVISVDNRGSGTNQALTIGTLTVNGNPTLTFNAGNGFFPIFNGARLNGLPTFLSNVGPGNADGAVRLTNVSGAGFVKTGLQHLHLTTANTYDGGTFINQGIIRARAVGSLGSGSVFLNPGATLDFEVNSVLNAGQNVFVRGNSAFMPMISVRTDIPHPTTGINVEAGTNGIIGLSNGTGGTYNTAINLATMYGGTWSLGGITSAAYDSRYTATTLGAGAGNLYRLGGGGSSFIFGQAAGTNAAINNILTGPNSVRLGFDSGNILPVNGTNFQFAIGGTHDFTGNTVIHRGIVARLFSNNNGTQSGLSSGSIDVFGTLHLAGAASLNSGGTNVNAVTLHPGAMLSFDNNNGAGNGAGVMATANVTNRFADGQAIALNGAMIELIGNNNNPSSEVLGAVTYSAGARLRVARNGSGTATLTLDSLTPASGPGHSLLLQSAAANSLGAASNFDRIFVTGGVPLVNNQAHPSIVNATDNRFVTYGANGFVNITNDVDVTTGTYAPGALNFNPVTMTGGKVDIGTTALTLQDNPVVYSLRTTQTINNGSFNTITIRSGGLLSAGAITINPNLVFNDGTANIEAFIYASAATTLNGQLTANGITKSGAGTLVINPGQPNYNSGWVVNSGALQVNDLQGLGQSVLGNAVRLNGTQNTGGSGAQILAATQLIFNRDLGTPELGVFTGGPITVVNEAIIRVAAANDRNLQIPNVTLQSTGSGSGVGFTLDVPFSRVRATIPTLTLNSDAIVRVFDSGNTVDTGRIVTGAVGSLVGSGRNLTKIGNRTLELSSDNSTTFTGGSITVGQGTVRVFHNGSLGSATTTATIERLAALEIGVANFSPIATLNQRPGSIERWNLETARGTGSYTLPAGVNLQLNTNLVSNTPRTINLNGGTIEGFLHTDHVAPAALRTTSSAVTFNLLSDSFVGQNVLLGLGYDAGRLPTVYQPFGNTFTGASLLINGPITGAFNLTKTGNDTVILGGVNTYNNTIVDMGLLRTAANNVMPTTGILTTRYDGTFDLHGFHQVVGNIGTLNSGPNPGAVGVGFSGSITNSGITLNALTAGNAQDYTYNGVIKQNVSLTKVGTGTLTLGAINSYRGVTTLSGGVLSVGTLADGGVNSSIGASSNAATNLVFNNGTLRYTGGNASTDRNFTLMPAGTIDVATAATNLTWNGASTGTGSFSKAGPGTLTLTAANAHTGNTNVNAGTLALTGTGSFAASPLITVASGATLSVTGVTGGANFAGGTFALASGQTISGSGTVSGSSTAVSGSAVRPGNPTNAGVLTVDGDVTLASGATFAVDIYGNTPGSGSSNYSRLTVTGATRVVTLTGSTLTANFGSYTPGMSDVYVIINNVDPTSTVVGEFSGFANGSLITVGGQDLYIYYNWDLASATIGGNDVALSVQPIPEPGMVLGILALAASAAGYYRRRKN